MKRFLILLLCLFMPAAALADLSRGSRGEDVKAVQEMLLDLGFLDDRADGIFGRKTEAAVKSFNRYLSIRSDGRLTAEGEKALTDLWQSALAIATEVNMPREEAIERFGSYCSWDNADLDLFVPCYRHLHLHSVLGYLKADPPDTLRALLEEELLSGWQSEMDSMYRQWEEEAPQAQKKIARQQRTIFEEALSREEKERTRTELALYLTHLGVDLCFDLYGAEPNP